MVLGNWRTIEAGLYLSEYAKRLCKEIGWPFAGNLTLICECIENLAYLKGVDGRGGFFILMEAVEHAKRNSIRVDRWFFQDGIYVEITNKLYPPESAQSEIPSPPTQSAPIIAAQRKPN